MFVTAPGFGHTVGVGLIDGLLVGVTLGTGVTLFVGVGLGVFVAVGVGVLDGLTGFFAQTLKCGLSPPLSNFSSLAVLLKVNAGAQVLSRVVGRLIPFIDQGLSPDFGSLS